jgi:hypothetical protein
MLAAPSRSIAAAVVLGAILSLLLALAACGSATHTSLAPLPAGSSGSVTLQTDVSSYSTSQPIGVTLHNSGKSTYYVQTGQSECTPLQLQLQVGTGWQNVMPCPSSQQPQSSAVTPGLTEPFTFAPGNAPGDSNAWEPGVYRFALQLTTSANGSGTATLVYSPGFRIVSPD